MHRNTIQFVGTEPVRRITLVAQGTMWPMAVESDGETWERTEVIEQTQPSETVRLYRHVPKVTSA